MSIQFSSDPALVLLTTLIGLAVLIMGRQIFWVFIAGLGFALGLLIASQYYNAQFEWQILLISAIIAALGALLAYTLQRLTAGIAGFATGWYLTMVLLSYFDLDIGLIETVLPYIVGCIGGFLIMAFYDWGVIIASSLAGSAIIVSGMTFAPNIELILLATFTLIGIVIQGIWFMQEK
jgi:hypothetical protein